MAKKKKKDKIATDYGQEWFDKEYTAREVYGRLWGFARRSKKVIFLGALLGMLTGGAWTPIFTSVQPMINSMINVASSDNSTETTTESTAITVVDTPATQDVAPTVASTIAEPTSQAAEPTPQKDKEAAKLEKKIEKVNEVASSFGIKSQKTTMILFAVVMVLGVIFKMTTQYFNHYLLAKAGMRVVMDVRNAMFEHLQQQSLTFHGRSDVGRLMSRATTDPETIRTLISQTMSDLCRAPFEIITAVAFVCYHAVINDMISLLVVAVVGYPMCMLPVVWIGKSIRKWSRNLLQQSANIGSNFHENLTCIRIVKAYHTEAEEIEKYNAHNLQAYKVCMRGVRLSTLVGPLTETVAILLALGFVAYCIACDHGLDEIIPLIPPFLIMYKPMKQLGRLQAAIESGRAALQRIFALLDVHEELKEDANPLPLKTFEKEVSFKHVNFAYVPGGKQIVKDANFTIKRGQMYAVVGSTGSGKSTIANLLARFYDVSEGCVEIDGNDIRKYAIADVRNIIGAVTQEAILFNTTIEKNIAYGTPNATREEIENAAKLANAHDFIVAHPEGYQRIVGEKGFVLSGGERQRVAIARAILRNPPILILDEATSALDTVTEQQVQAAINNLMKNRTTFAIAHRLSTIKMADCILVLDQGEIVERGTHDELYAKGGVYRKLCDIQDRQ